MITDSADCMDCWPERSDFFRWWIFPWKYYTLGNFHNHSIRQSSSAHCADYLMRGFGEWDIDRRHPAVFGTRVEIWWNNAFTRCIVTSPPSFSCLNLRVFLTSATVFVVISLRLGLGSRSLFCVNLILEFWLVVGFGFECGDVIDIVSGSGFAGGRIGCGQGF